jgi:chloride channel protein, CIC family
MRRQAGDFFERAKMTEHTSMIVVAILIGLLAGFAAIGIRWLIKEVSMVSFGAGGESLLSAIIEAPWYLKILAPVVGGAVVGPLIHFMAPEAKGHGVPEVMQAILLKGGSIRPRVAAVKAFASAVTIGTGGSVGREGPIIQIGSSLGSTVGQFFGFPTKRLKTLVGCGAAAGIAAAFNAPIAGALFAVEIILMDFAVAQFSPIVIASVMATVVSHHFEGNFAAFEVPSYQLVSPYELGGYFALGALTGLVSYLFIKVLYFSEDVFDNRVRLPDYVKPVLGGLGIGVIALAFPHVMGVGYDTINQALHGDLVWKTALALIFVKILATSLTLGSGGSGGVFAPSLFMGATLGAFFGYFVHYLFPQYTASPGAYALVAMGGMVAGSTRAPITAIIIVFELTKDYNIILPLMITCIIATILSTKLSRESIYTLKLLMRNIAIKEGSDVNVMESIFVKNVFRSDVETLAASDNFNRIASRFIRGAHPILPVLDGAGGYVGVVSMDEVKEYLFEKDELETLVIANDLADANAPHTTPEENCQTAVDKMRRSDLDALPVLDARDRRKLLGVIRLADVQDAYQKEIERREISANLASKITMKDEETHVQFIEGYSISEIKPPKAFYGKSIAELQIRTVYGVDVLSIKRTDKKGLSVKAIPNPGHVVEEGETLVVAGEIESINRLKTLD